MPFLSLTLYAAIVATPSGATEVEAPRDMAIATYRMTPLVVSANPDGYGVYTPDGKGVIYSSVRDGNRDLYLRTLAGGEERRLTTHPADDGGPVAVEPGGKTIVFRSKRGGEHYNLYSLALEGGDVKRLTRAEGGEGYPDYSPDGRRIAYHSERDQTADDNNLEYYTQRVGVRRPKRVSEAPAWRNTAPDWFPDGRRLIGVARNESGTQVQIVDAASAEILQTFAETQRQDTFLGALSPDGKRFVFYSSRGGGYHLFLLDLESGAVEQITAGKATYSTPDWSPDGRRILVQYDDGSPSDLWELHLDQPVTLDYTLGRDLLFNADNRYAYPTAVEHLEKAVAERPEFAPAQLALAAAYLKVGKRDEALASLARSAEGSDQLTADEKLWLRRMRHNVAGDPAAEIEVLQEIVARDAGDRWAWYELARAQMELEAFDAAAEAADRAVALGGNWEGSWLHYLHSKALYRGGRYQEAVAAAEAGRGQETTWRSTLFRQTLAQFKAGQVEQAEENLAEYIRWSHEEGRTPDAFIDLNVGLFYHELGDLDAALEYLRRGYEKAPDTTYSIWALGYVLADAHRVDEAKALLEDGMEAHPGRRDLLDAYGWALYREGEFARALDYFERARQAASGHSQQVLNHIALAKRALETGEVEKGPTPWLG